MSELCMKSMELNQLVSEKLLYPRYALNYHIKTKRFEVEQSRRRLLSWYWHQWGVACFSWSCTWQYFLIYKGIFCEKDETISTDQFFFSALVFSPWFLNSGLNFALYNARNEAAQYLNLIVSLRSSFVRKPKNNAEGKEPNLMEMLIRETNKLLRRYLPQKGGEKRREDADVVGLIMNMAVIYFALGPIIFLPGSLIAAHYITKPVVHIYELGKIGYTGFLTLFTYTSVICCMECCRTFRTVFLTLIFSAKITVTILLQIRDISKTNISKAIEQYQLLYVIHTKAKACAGGLLFVAVEGGIFIAVFSLTGTFVGWKLLSPLVYWLCPFMAALTLIIIAIAMPCASYSAETSIEMLRDWNYRVEECRKGTRKYNVVTLKTLQPVAFYMNFLGDMVGETKTNMFTTIVMNTVDTVLMCMSYVD